MSEDGTECPLPYCNETIGRGHWIASGNGSHTYHTDKETVAKTWEHRDGLDVTPSTEPRGQSVQSEPDRSGDNDE